jgi:hypothetical protein
MHQKKWIRGENNSYLKKRKTEERAVRMLEKQSGLLSKARRRI